MEGADMGVLLVRSWWGTLGPRLAPVHPKKLGSCSLGYPRNMGFPSVAAGRTIGIDMTAATASEVRGDIRRLCHSGLEWVALSEQAGKLIRKAVPHERVCWHPTDPASSLVMGSYVENLSTEGLPP